MKNVILLNPSLENIGLDKNCEITKREFKKFFYLVIIYSLTILINIILLLIKLENSELEEGEVFFQIAVNYSIIVSFIADLPFLYLIGKVF